MRNLLLDSLSSISDKLSNNYDNDSTLERTQCLVKNEVEILSKLWNIPDKEALILAVIAILKINKCFLLCKISDISKLLGVENIELIKYYKVLRSLEENGWITSQSLEKDNIEAYGIYVKHLVVLPTIKELSFKYDLGDKISKQIFN